jgi:hypothetical protein
MVVCALFAVAGHVSSLAHQSLVQHTICAEHGELIELQSLVSQGSSARALDDVDAVSSAAPLVGAERGDDHCAILANRRDQAPEARLVEHVGSLIAAQALSPLVGAVCPPQVPSLRQAPKQSPPA